MAVQKNAQTKGRRIDLPGDFRKIPRHIVAVFERTVLSQDIAVTLDLVALLAWRANMKRNKISRKLVDSSAGRFLEVIDKVIRDWEDEHQKLASESRIYLYTELFELLAANACRYMHRQHLAGLRASL